MCEGTLRDGFGLRYRQRKEMQELLSEDAAQKKKRKSSLRCREGKRRSRRMCEGTLRDGFGLRYRQRKEMQELLSEDAAQKKEEEEDSVKLCICSPTTHAGSFRCRFHRSSYQWPRRFLPKNSFSQS
eukprot:TRINITY_DN22929_c0_g1_i2.p1 TRINITY_DN22929_c0_g1~~TRINITY_DN22929_c0_g1_i2.p1  ORF type:complete len:127 (+),score=29.80 TRINITY_DN22929_c0_g1_i2:203-583(+)